MENKTILAMIAVVLGFFIVLGMMQLGSPTGAAVAGQNGLDYCLGTQRTENCGQYDETSEEFCESFVEQDNGDLYQCIYDGENCNDEYQCIPRPITKDLVILDDISCKEWNLCFVDWLEETTTTDVNGTLIEQSHKLPLANKACVVAAYQSITGNNITLTETGESEIPIPPECIEEKDPAIHEVTLVIEAEIDICPEEFESDCSNCDPSNCGGCTSYIDETCDGDWCHAGRCTGPVENNGPECTEPVERCYPIGLPD
jgi:hypothetical protein